MSLIKDLSMAAMTPGVIVVTIAEADVKPLAIEFEENSRGLLHRWKNERDIRAEECFIRGVPLRVRGPA